MRPGGHELSLTLEGSHVRAYMITTWDTTLELMCVQSSPTSLDSVTILCQIGRCS